MGYKQGNNNCLNRKYKNYQITLSGDRNENKIVTDTNFFTFWTLFWSWMKSPPASLTYKMQTKTINAADYDL